MKRNLLLLALFAVLGSLPLYSHANPGWTNHTKVLELIPTSQKRYRVRLAMPRNPSGCKAKEWFFQDYSASGSDKMFQVLLEALLKEQPIRVYVTGRCELNGYSEISSVSINAK